MSKRKITFTTIAKKTGLSIASVSRVVHTPHLTSQQTQSRVNNAIAELNFDAEGVFKLPVKHHDSKKILVIDNQLMANTLINSGIESKAKQAGYKLLYLRFLYFNDQEIQQIISYTINHHLDGILIINDSPYLKKLLQFEQALPPIVLVNQFLLNVPCVYFDHLSIAYQATQYLIGLGHQRVAILLGDLNKTEVHQLKNGYMQALARADIPVVADYICYQSMGYLASRQKAKHLMKLACPPTAIICPDHLCLNYTDRDQLPVDDKFNQYMTTESSICGVIDQCRAMHIAIPDKLSLLQFIHSKGDKQYHLLNHICAVYKPLFSMGEQAMALLISLLNSQQGIRITQLIESELVIRNSSCDVGHHKHKWSS